MNALLAYQFDTEPVRVVMIDGAPWFVASDVCGALDIKNSRDAIDKLDDDEKGVALTDTLGGKQELNVVSESGMYALCLRARDAMKAGTVQHRFRKWVTAEVLPSIRRTGQYALPGHLPPAAPPELALNLDPVSVGVGLQVVRDAKRLFGPEAARQLWIDIGLPQPIVDAEPTIEGDPLLPAAKAYLDGRKHVRAGELAEAIGLDPDRMPDRRRAIELLRFSGWRTWSKRVGGVNTKVWVPRSSVEG